MCLCVSLVLCIQMANSRLAFCTLLYVRVFILMCRCECVSAAASTIYCIYTADRITCIPLTLSLLYCFPVPIILFVSLCLTHRCTYTIGYKTIQVHVPRVNIHTSTSTHATYCAHGHTHNHVGMPAHTALCWLPCCFPDLHFYTRAVCSSLPRACVCVCGHAFPNSYFIAAHHN